MSGAESKKYNAALYMRLSREDEGAGESSSISSQRKLLTSFANENGFNIYNEYTDDGYSGTSFTRPAFLRLLDDIENGFVNMVITKDLSRLGRDYITTGEYTERFFPEHRVRYIAVNDGYDSQNDYSDIAPIKNVINEMYARDASKKIRSAVKSKMLAGDYIGNFAPYGYKKSDENKNHLIIDYETYSVVRKIFDLAAGGAGPKEIAEHLNSDNILSPMMYRCKKYNLDVDKFSKSKKWVSGTICKMLRNPVYIGHTLQGKTTKLSFKSDVQMAKPRDEWIIVYNTHEPIISEDIFNTVGQRVQKRRCAPKNDFINVFSGIAVCADCKRKMSATGTRKKDSAANLVCAGYKLYGKNKCTNHFIAYESLYDIVLSDIRKHLNQSDEDKAKIIRSIQAKLKNNDINISQNHIKTKKLIAELDGIIKKLYKDNAAGRITNERFDKLLNDYEKEQAALIEHEESMQKPFIENEKEQANFLSELLDKVMALPELTPQILHCLIDKIEIGQGYYEKSSGGRVKHQTADIYYKFNIE